MIESTKAGDFRIPVNQWIRAVLRCRAMRMKMLKEMNALRNLSDEHLRDIGLHRSSIDRYIIDLRKSGFCR